MTGQQSLNESECNFTSSTSLSYDAPHIIIMTHFCTIILYIAVGATAVPSTTKIFPAPVRPLKTKRDPKKLRLAGGQAWRDHSLDDWDQSKFKSSVTCYVHVDRNIRKSGFPHNLVR